MRKRLTIGIFGQVQGVWFRQTAQTKARELELLGFVRNLPEGSVYIEAEGGKEALEKFLTWCRSGPPLAQVDRIETAYFDELKNFTSFEIR